jgi:arabinogalactan oligomer/maltooligosaccharide transport system substrate-binding protein
MKKILALVLAVLMVLSMVACAKTEETGKTAGDITVKVWADNLDLEWVTKMQENFVKDSKYANIKFENVAMGEGEAKAAVVQDVTAAADVYMFANDQIGELVQAQGLTKLVGDYQKALLDNNTQFMVDTVTYQGNQYGFPLTNNTYYLYYNKDVFTADDVKSLDAMVAKAKVHLPWSNAWTAPTLFLAVGGNIFGANGQDLSAGITFGGDAGLKAAKKMAELAHNENVIMGDLDISKMINGEAHATISGSWVRGDLEKEFGDKLGVVMLPKVNIEGTEYQMKALSGSKCVGVNPNTAKVEGKQAAATAFAAYLASEEAQLARFEMRGMIPAHKNLANNEKVLADQVAKAEIENINNAGAIQPLLPEMGTHFWTPMGTFAGKVATKQCDVTTVELIFNEMVAAMNP